MSRQAQQPDEKPKTRIQLEKTEAILEAALEVFSAHGFRGATLDAIAEAAGLSKPNLLYYFESKEAVHNALLARLLDTWLDPLISMDATGDPLEELLTYVQRKLEMARVYPRESRLFANEILQGAPRIQTVLAGELKTLVDEKAQVIEDWIASGRIARVHPHHLIFSIWATTQHYADFSAQVGLVLEPGEDPFPDAAAHLNQMFTKLLTP